jgi:hypothetical protein
LKIYTLLLRRKKKKKLIQFCIALLVIFAAFTSCANTTDSRQISSHPMQSDGSGTGLNVQYIRTEYFSDAEYPNPAIITVVSSKNSLQEYYEKQKKRVYGSSGNLLPDSDLLEAIEKYSDDYFTGNFLVIVGLVEGSGSIRHKVERIDENGNIIIKRLLPEMGTADMAAWSIIIELGNSAKGEQFKAVLVDERAY